ncbi:hypothetical protein KQX54_012397 [Cotesia glomerata]|uniref:Uncharacterized protein n=1 Tax=Cotesia glomerata TaxID=32391 RepID=A0AAV7J3I5_COTGL|nr:hypothetical protein KQX54_012397 [Cotesia glomerata]
MINNMRVKSFRWRRCLKGQNIKYTEPIVKNETKNVNGVGEEVDDEVEENEATLYFRTRMSAWLHDRGRHIRGQCPVKVLIHTVLYWVTIRRDQRGTGTSFII